jgi:TetR/AcrR family transcriptional repressor of mexJK operon
VVGLKDSGDLAADLRDLARRLLERVVQPRLLQLRRLVIGEAERFPELGRTFYERGPGRTIDDLAFAFAQLAARGELDLDDDPRLAASQFSWLIMSAPINQAMLLGHDNPLPPGEIEQLAGAAVRTFLAAYQRD